MKERFIRTNSGDIWQLNDLGIYRKPDVTYALIGEENCVIKKSDSIFECLIEGDLVRTEGHIVEVDAELLKIYSNNDIDEIYTRIGDKYLLQAKKIDDEWRLW